MEISFKFIPDGPIENNSSHRIVTGLLHVSMDKF